MKKLIALLALVACAASAAPATVADLRSMIEDINDGTLQKRQCIVLGELAYSFAQLRDRGRDERSLYVDLIEPLRVEKPLLTRLSTLVLVYVYASWVHTPTKARTNVTLACLANF